MTYHLYPDGWDLENVDRFDYPRRERVEGSSNAATASAGCFVSTIALQLAFIVAWLDASCFTARTALVIAAEVLLDAMVHSVSSYRSDVGAGQPG